MQFYDEEMVILFPCWFLTSLANVLLAGVWEHKINLEHFITLGGVLWLSLVNVLAILSEWKIFWLLLRAVFSYLAWIIGGFCMTSLFIFSLLLYCRVWHNFSDLFLAFRRYVTNCQAHVEPINKGCSIQKSTLWRNLRALNEHCVTFFFMTFMGYRRLWKRLAMFHCVP